MVSFTHEQNIICSQTQLDNIVHEQTVNCRHLFEGHVVGSRPMKRRKNFICILLIFFPETPEEWTGRVMTVS